MKEAEARRLSASLGATAFDTECCFCWVRDVLGGRPRLFGRGEGGCGGSCCCGVLRSLREGLWISSEHALGFASGGLVAFLALALRVNGGKATAGRKSTMVSPPDSFIPILVDGTGQM